MKKYAILFLSFLFLIFVGNIKEVFSQNIPGSDCFYSKSLHYDAHGMAYWYSKEQGGIEKLTEIPYEKLPCSHCHILSCDKCHKTKENGKLVYSVKIAKNMKKNCLRCHARERAILGLMKKTGIPDVHFSKGMNCVSCHSGKDIHGDGKRYVSMREPGAINVKCENCHKNNVPNTISHTIHKGKLDCTACHVAQTITCANCHMDTMIKEKKKIAILLHGWTFLINYKGKVVSGNIQTFVVGKNKTFMLMAPYFSHYVTKKGKKCDECHGTKTVKQIQRGSITITWIENGTLTNLKGVIPIVEGVEYKNAFMDYKNGKWIPLENAEKPLIQFPAFGKPLTKKQLQKLAIPFEGKK